jgi:hypothetical protein
VCFSNVKTRIAIDTNSPFDLHILSKMLHIDVITLLQQQLILAKKEFQWIEIPGLLKGIKALFQ